MTTATRQLPYVEAREEYHKKKKELEATFDRYPNISDMPTATAEGARQLMSDLKSLEKQLTEPSGIVHPGGGSRGAGAEGALGRAIIDSDVFKSFDFKGRGQVSAGIDVPLSVLEQKNTITATQFAPQSIREDLILPKATESPSVADLFAQGTTEQSSYVYMEETTLTNAAAETAEGGAKPESALAYTEQTSPVRKIASFLRVSDETMRDIASFGAYVSQRVPALVRFREDQQLINGDGIAPNLKGILNFTGIQTQAKGADPTPDAIYKAITLIRTNAFEEADGMIIHPADWQDIRLLRTADGVYIWGNPAEYGARNMFGLAVCITTRCPQNTCIVGAFKTCARLVRREALRVAFSTEDASNFTSNLVTVLAELREALVCYRGAGFAQITGV